MERGWIERPPRRLGDTLYQRYAVKTHLIRPGERLERTLSPYLDGALCPGDWVVLSEKAVAIGEGRAVPLRAVRPRPLARWLAARVSPLGYGVGLHRPETMEVAIREAGIVRILAAAVVGAAERARGGRGGGFYRVVGRRVAAIDGPGPETIPPYDRYIVLAPLRAGRLAERMARRFGAGVAVVDVNDVGSEVLEASPGVDREAIRTLLNDNPLGQGRQGTPLAVLRPVGAAPPIPGDLAPGTVPDLGGWPGMAPVGGDGPSVG